MVLTFTKPHRLSQLLDEIIAAHPTLKGVVHVEGRKTDGLIRLTLPDDVRDPGLARVVNAHAPDFTPPAPDPALTRLRAWVRDPAEPPPSRAVVLDALRRVARDLFD
jgi:hypothetical protein